MFQHLRCWLILFLHVLYVSSVYYSSAKSSFSFSFLWTTAAARMFSVPFQFFELTKHVVRAAVARAVLLTSGRLYMSYRSSAIATGRIASSITTPPQSFLVLFSLFLPLRFIIISFHLSFRVFFLPVRHSSHQLEVGSRAIYQQIAIRIILTPPPPIKRFLYLY